MANDLVKLFLSKSKGAIRCTAVLIYIVICRAKQESWIWNSVDLLLYRQEGADIYVQCTTSLVTCNVLVKPQMTDDQLQVKMAHAHGKSSLFHSGMQN